VVGCSRTVSRVPSASLPTITPEAIPPSPLLTSLLIAVAPCGGSQSCHAPATHSHSPVTPHDLPTHAHRHRARSQSCGQQCLHRNPSTATALPITPHPPKILCHYPHSAHPPAASFNPASVSSRSPRRSGLRRAPRPHSSRFQSTA